MVYSDPAKKLANQRKWVANNLDAKRAYDTKWRRENPDRNAENVRRYKEANKDRLRDQRAERYANNAEAENKRSQAWRDANRPLVRAIYRESHFKRAYGISVAQRDAMLEAQGGVCAVCGSGEPGTKKGWHVDHCHKTKKVRGILCHGCNAAAGHAKDDPSRLRQIAAYLERHE
jgi:hypothetical protein